MSSSFDSLIQLIERLRDKEKGCPWDLKQTQTTLLPQTLEELYELIFAVKNKDSLNTKEELGDLLFHLVFYARIAEENNEYDINDVIDSVVNKMIYRHPHIFSNRVYRNEKEQKEDWQRLKKAEKEVNQPSLFSNHHHLNGFLQALHVQKEMAQFGFDWDNKKDVLEKVEEELQELKDDISSDKDPSEEYGDLLLSMINLARHLDISPELALIKSVNKFTKRSQKMMTYVDNKETFSKMTLDQKESLWQKAKHDC